MKQPVPLRFQPAAAMVRVKQTGSTAAHAFHGAFRCFPRKEKGSHGGHGVHGAVDRYRPCGSASFLSLMWHRLKPGSTDSSWPKTSVSPWTPCEPFFSRKTILSVDAGKRRRRQAAPLLRARIFTARSAVFQRRRKARTEVTVFTVGSIDIELAARLPS
jgi:hypothetical protein